MLSRKQIWRRTNIKTNIIYVDKTNLINKTNINNNIKLS